jgi:hypothetical protein
MAARILQHSHWLVLTAAALLVWMLTGGVLHPSMDEGIYLEGAQRLRAGQIPYRDFFAYTGPLIYLVQAALEAAFGRDISMLRLSVALSVGLMTAGAYGIAQRLAGWRTGLLAAIAFLGFLAPSLYRFIVNHRWLSAGLFTFAMFAVLEKRWRLAGVCAALAVWATPSFALPFLAVLACVWLTDRQQTLGFLLASIVVSAPIAAWLIAQGAFQPMLERLFWASQQYARANAVPYAYYPGLRFDPSLGRILGVLRLLGPAWILPLILAIACWRKETRWMGILGAAFWLTSYPRWDVNQLIFVLPPFWALGAAWIAQRWPDLAKTAAAAVTAMLSFYFFAQLLAATDQFAGYPSRAGQVRGDSSDLQALERLEKAVPQGETLYVYPYMPVMGFYLGARNPVSFSYLQPGMMSSADEARVLADLQRNPPRFVLKQWLPRDQVLNIWPGSDLSRMDFILIEEFLASRYRFVDQYESSHFRLRLLERLN